MAERDRLRAALELIVAIADDDEGPDAYEHKIAREALHRKVGARGLRMILEDLMLDLMYNLPAQRKVREFSVTAEMVRSR